MGNIGFPGFIWNLRSHCSRSPFSSGASECWRVPHSTARLDANHQFKPFQPALSLQNHHVCNPKSIHLNICQHQKSTPNSVNSRDFRIFGLILGHVIHISHAAPRPVAGLPGPGRPGRLRGTEASVAVTDASAGTAPHDAVRCAGAGAGEAAPRGATDAKQPRSQENLGFFSDDVVNHEKPRNHVGENYSL